MRLVLQWINVVNSNSIEGTTNICQLKNLILTLLGLIFRLIYIYIRLNNLWSLPIFQIRLQTLMKLVGQAKYPST